ncbi:MAG: hypothetical protein QM758_08300 [Armatimonas sp.]
MVESNWSITLGDRAEILIRDETGLPVRLFLPAHHNETAKGNTLSGASLEAQARKYQGMFSGLGQFADPPQVIPTNTTTGEVMRSFDWTRMYRSVLFESQSLRVSVNSVSGELVAAQLENWGALPTNSLGTIGQARAQEIALKRVREAFSDSPCRLVRSLRRIVQRNRYWIDRSPYRLPESRFAWLVIVMVSEKPPQWITVGIDSQTGEPISGELLENRG